MDACGASSSSFASSTPENYDVFLSFRGEDTREKFTSHLYAALVRKKIKTYIDEVSLERGDEISPALLEAIRKSKISVIVFSKDYASSSWCLSELVHILECHREDKQMVIPIFYEVDPSHIRKQEGSYGEAFLKHQERFNDRLETVQKWRVALTESSNLSGWDSRVTRPESKLVEAIVEDVLRKLNRDQSTNLGFEGLVGIEKHIQEIKLLLSVSSPKVRIVGIWGMGGIGRTTLAQVLFHQLASQFEARCFIPNVREESQKGSLINLRNKLLGELLKEENLNVGTPSLGPTFVKERLQRTKVFIVLDDVNHVEQLNTFVGDRDQFSCESRIVITTRDAALLRDIFAEGIYEVKQLEFEESLQLFNSIAFRGKFPTGDYSELSRNVVLHAGGVPLAITVLASHFRSLRSQTKEAWEAALDKLKVVPHDGIHKVLRISFDGLDNTEKDIFLDIACFFKGMRRDYAENLLNGCGFFATTGIDVLIDKSLVTSGLWMHDLLEEMGQKIVREESTELGQRSRLWSAEDACQVLEDNEGTAKIQGIFLDLSKIGRAIHLEPTTFTKMSKLRVLKIYVSDNNKNCEVYFQNGLQYLPHSLRYLEWHAYPLNSLPPNFKLNNLVELKMTYSQLEKLWDGVQDLEKLRHIDLSNSIHLNQIPDLSRAPNLEIINLEYCTSLRQVPWNILQNLDRLTDVNLSHCINLCSFSGRIDARSLRTLTLQGCSNLNTLPMIMTRSLVSLNLSSTAIEYLTSSICSLNNLSELNLNYCRRLANLPSKINELDSLKYLKLSGCSALQKFPELPRNVIELDIGWTAIEEVTSSSIEGCFDLNIINLSFCNRLKSLPTNIFRLRSLARLYLSYCSRLKKLPEILEPMESLDTLILTGTGIRQLPSSIGHLNEVVELEMDWCEKLESIPSSIWDMAGLSCLILTSSNITEIPESIKGISELSELHISDCKNLRSLRGLPSSLEILDAGGCESLEVVSYARGDVAHSRHLRIGAKISFFLGCLKLDEKAKDNIVTDFQVIIRNEREGADAMMACYPGNEIPKWFEHQSEGSSIHIKLQPQWNNANFLGFVLCAVADYSPGTAGFDLVCKFNPKPNQRSPYEDDYEFNVAHYMYEHWLPTSNSNHVYMYYWRGGACRKCEEEASFDFDFREWNWMEDGDYEITSSKCQVKKCGIHMLYRRDLEEPIPFRHQHLLEESDAIPDQPESSACGAVNFDTDEPHPKRIKFYNFF